MENIYDLIIYIYILDGVLPFNHFQEFHFDNKMSWVMNKGSFFWLESHQGFLNIKTLEMLLLFYFPAEPEEDGDLFVGQRIWGEKIDEKSCHGTPSTPKDPDVSILKGFYVYTPIFLFWLVVSTPLKNISQIGNLPQIGVKIKKMKPPPSYSGDGIETINPISIGRGLDIFGQKNSKKPTSTFATMSPRNISNDTTSEVTSLSFHHSPSPSNHPIFPELTRQPRREAQIPR